MWKTYPNGREFSKEIRSVTDLNADEVRKVLSIAELFEVTFTAYMLDKLEEGPFSEKQLDNLSKLEGRTFQHAWEIKVALAELSDDFKYRAQDKD